MDDITGRASRTEGVSAGSVVSGVVASKNPHYQPPVMRWNYVEIICPEGSAVRVATDSHGLLLLEVIQPGDTMVSQMSPEQLAHERITPLPPGRRVFGIRDDTRGPPIDHEYAPNEHGWCQVCGGDGSGWKPGRLIGINSP